MKLGTNKNGTRGGTSNLISQTRPTYQIVAHLNILATRGAEGAPIYNINSCVAKEKQHAKYQLLTVVRL